MNPRKATSESFDTTQKLALFHDLAQKTRKTLNSLENKTSVSGKSVEAFFQAWRRRVVEMRLWQEYETIKGLLVTSE